MSATAFSRPPQAKPAPAPVALNRTKVPSMLPANALQLVEQAVGDYFVWVENDVTLEQIMTPSWWANHTKLRPGAGVRVARRDLTLVASLMVERVETGMVSMIKLSVPRNGEPSKDTTSADAGKAARGELDDLPAGYKVKHIPNPAGYHAWTPQGDRLTSGGLTEAQAHGVAVAHFTKANTPQG
jgi:hypothetical protein